MIYTPELKALESALSFSHRDGRSKLDGIRKTRVRLRKISLRDEAFGDSAYFIGASVSAVLNPKTAARKETLVSDPKIRNKIAVLLTETENSIRKLLGPFMTNGKEFGGLTISIVDRGAFPGLQIEHWRPAFLPIKRGPQVHDEINEALHAFFHIHGSYEVWNARTRQWLGPKIIDTARALETLAANHWESKGAPAWAEWSAAKIQKIVSTNGLTFADSADKYFLISYPAFALGVAHLKAQLRGTARKRAAVNSKAVRKKKV